MAGKKTTLAWDCLNENSCERGLCKVDCISCLDCLQLLLKKKTGTRSWSSCSLFAVFADIFSLTTVEKDENGRRRKDGQKAQRMKFLFVRPLQSAIMHTGSKISVPGYFVLLDSLELSGIFVGHSWIINNYWTRLGKISWFVSGKQINYLPKPN